MTSAKMTHLITVIALMTVFAGSFAFAGSGYDSCRQEEKRLRLDEADQCSGWGYIFNPSACFNTRKALAPYAGGKCRAIAVSEGVTEEKVEAAAVPAPPAPAAQPAKERPAAAELPGQPALAKETTSAALARPSELELLKKEVAELKTELKLLKKEVLKLRGAR